MAIKPKGKTENVTCFFWFSSDLGSMPVIVQGIVKEMQSYASENAYAYIKCPSENQTEIKMPPLYVALANEHAKSPNRNVQLLVENREMCLHSIFENKTAFSGNKNNTGSDKHTYNKRIVEFTVCIPPMFKYDNAAQLVEKLEMVRLLGAGRVVLYNNSIAHNVHSVLHFYTQQWAAGNETLEVVVHPWNLPPIHVSYFGQIAAMDDCLYRYGWLSQYMVFDDLDEIMVPLRHDNWSVLIAEREKLYPDHVAFMFRSSVMNKDHSSPAHGFQADAFRYRSSVLAFTQRDNFIYEPNNKGKLIINPRKVETMEVHHVYEGNGPTDIIPVNQGILYHYRWPLLPCHFEVKDSRVASKFGKRLLARLKSVWSRLKSISMGGELPRPGFLRVSSEIFQRKHGEALEGLHNTINAANDIVLAGCGKTYAEAYLSIWNLSDA
ncbi:UDP-galactose:beta-D-galactoside beta-1,4-galactosyltransferase [Elysia marginata]|uniref:Glycosyltransferase family 92 protein n=1 Tax=Elysia marginata TaxID=1093978 RepID=A0AAV4FEC9_9GAST|nr:UDP-galactose:beta-D-galactoside beta-1,4-galactosyltransferase [Elysia marginata]